MTQKLTLLTFAALFIAFMFNACSDVAGPNENLDSQYSQLNSEEAENADLGRRMFNIPVQEEGDPEQCPVEKTYVLGYGDNLNPAGDVVIEFLGNNMMSVTFKTNDPWVLKDWALHIAQDFNGLPTTGNPNNPNLPPGQLEIQSSDFDDFDYGATEFTVKVSLSDYNINVDDIFVIAAKASLDDSSGEIETETQTGWGLDKPGGNGFWQYIEITNKPCEEPVKIYGGAS